MKHFFIFLSIAFLSMNVWSDNKESNTTSSKGSNTTSTTNTVDLSEVPSSNGKDKRSLQVVPYAVYDATTLYLSAPLSWEGVEVTLYDAYGSVLFTDVVTLSPSTYPIDLTGFGTKAFVIEIATDETAYQGEFSL